MIRVVPFTQLGRFDNDWLAARYHFSFAGFHDPERMGLGPLRVWNDDRIKPKGGFAMHPHRDMEIITYVRQGTLTHEDNLGNQGHIAAGEVQVMSAGSGIVHAERNDGDVDVLMFQIWVRPDTTGLPPRWEQARVAAAHHPDEFVTLVSGREGRGLRINQDAELRACVLSEGASVRHELEAGRRAYLVAPRGKLIIQGQTVEARGGVAIDGVPAIDIRAIESSEIVLLDLP
jgi:redox-sensitive bicupin YhaK (pirin superfamily)